ncbi:hypothetical protein QBC35DRAFT_241012 [Podospora australis]|uniref:Uncharacterized protein n=1 Tax=Podospora australis TaxID=1536484 RepID=A0AAN7AIR2_9PEZI|nr:hypothetical protein QBC35DRAFT_241012 [Podospora australis]
MSAEDIITAAPEQYLLAALSILCSQDSKVSNRLADYIDFIQEHGGSQDVKQDLSGLHLCESCNQPFFEETNKDGACNFHDGYAEVNDDSSMWDD